MLNHYSESPEISIICIYSNYNSPVFALDISESVLFESDVDPTVATMAAIVHLHQIGINKVLSDLITGTAGTNPQSPSSPNFHSYSKN